MSKEFASPIQDQTHNGRSKHQAEAILDRTLALVLKKLLRLYLSIEQVRFEDRLRVHMVLSEDAVTRGYSDIAADREALAAINPNPLLRAASSSARRSACGAAPCADFRSSSARAIDQSTSAGKPGENTDTCSVEYSRFQPGRWEKTIASVNQ